MSLLEKLEEKETWSSYFEYKTSKNLLPKKEVEKLEGFIEEEKYDKIVKDIIKGTYIFDYPKKYIISKKHTNKKRTVYSFNSEEENYVMKVLSYLIYEYDTVLASNCYAFRKDTGVKKAIAYITKRKVSNLYGYKLDISNYFNSINVNILLEILKKVLNDEKLYALFKQILLSNKVYYKAEIIEEEKGVMAGTPLSPFFANIYLKEMDHYFYDNKITYLRYSDDILIFAETKNELDNYVEIIKSFLNKYKLEINEEKETYYEPHEKIEFLGFSYSDGKIDLGDKTISKIKGKIRRSARGIRRWMLRKDIKKISALKAMTRKYNRKFFREDSGHELTWSKWFFPIINKTDGLKEIDLYMQDCLRYIITGRHVKKDKKLVSYSMLKEANYRALVSEYYKKVETSEELIKQ